MYGHLKGDLAEIVADFVEPFGARTRELLERPRPSSTASSPRAPNSAREVASVTLDLVYDRSGFVRPS